MKDIAIRLTYLVSVICLILGALFKIQHWVGGNIMRTAGTIAAVLFTLFSISEIYQSDKKTVSKVAWTIIFLAAIFTSILPLYLGVAVIYIQNRRKRIVARKKII